MAERLNVPVAFVAFRLTLENELKIRLTALGQVTPLHAIRRIPSAVSGKKRKNASPDVKQKLLIKIDAFAVYF